MHARGLLGRAGEDLAARIYRDRGFEILDRNYRCPDGEIDVIAGRGRLIVFCEVKTRRGGAFGDPSEAVGAVKRVRLRRVAARWLRERGRRGSEIRFDVVSVIVRAGQAEATMMPDAF